MRDLLGLLRKFDMPSEDIRMARLFEIVERLGVKPEWQDGFERMKAAYSSRNDPSDIQIKNPDLRPATTPRWVSPRDAFELWVYGGVIHDDFDKQQRWQRFDVFEQAFVRQMGYDYMLMLLAQAAQIRRVITHGLITPVLPSAE